jgi:hypothetical protein
MAKRTSASQRRSAEKDQKSQTPNPVALKSDEEKYQEELKQDAAEERRQNEERRVVEMNGAGTALAKDATALAEEAAALAKDAQIVAEEAGKVGAADAEKEKAVAEAVKVLAESHPDACDPAIFGSFDLNSDYCQDCVKQFKDCAEACKTLTEHRKAQAPQGKKSSSASGGTARAARPKTGPVSKFSQSYLTMQNGKIDVSLESHKTLTKHAEDTETTVSRVKSHIAWLIKNRADKCKKIEADGKIHFELI